MPHASDHLKGALLGLASEMATSIFGSDDGIYANAQRHAYWNAYSVYLTGDESYVRDFTNAHEYGHPNNFSSEKAFRNSEMDLHNNALGRQIAVNAISMGGRNMDAIFRIINNSIIHGRYISGEVIPFIWLR